MQPDWTEGRVKSFITSALRGGFRRWPEKYKALKRAERGKKVNPISGRIATFYQCALCEKEFTAKNVQCDHREPVVDPVVGFIDWNTFIKRLFCSEENLQILCVDCHKNKTKEEKKKGKLKLLSTKKQ